MMKLNILHWMKTTAHILPCVARKAFHVIWILPFRWCNVRLHISVLESPCLCALQRSLLHPCAQNLSFRQTFLTFTKYWLKRYEWFNSIYLQRYYSFLNFKLQCIVFRLNTKCAHNILGKYYDPFDLVIGYVLLIK